MEFWLSWVLFHAFSGLKGLIFCKNIIQKSHNLMTGHEIQNYWNDLSLTSSTFLIVNKLHFKCMTFVVQAVFFLDLEDWIGSFKQKYVFLYSKACWFLCKVQSLYLFAVINFRIEVHTQCAVFVFCAIKLQFTASWSTYVDSNKQ